MAVRATYVLTDAQGQSVLRTVTTSTGIGAIETAIQAHSNGAIVSCSEGVLTIYATLPVVAPYNSVRISARIIFTSATNSIGSVYLDSPDAAIFLPNGDQVDPLQIPDLIAACIGNLLCGDGTPATAFVGGEIIRTKLSAIATLS